ncbi:hypothetical protein [Albidovulum sediminis]|uniref:SMODS and SLOG-associating 2TM effector domain-containing protein n=1 Tax=Albidovulum sediminis TaxID=3066345 RepID=A0ABT2NP38_9RHOB|nr:hypothetical protein [Defluviimonas sediminis]MCT8330702.1 hypothetical protein [Defluviimonas sediminis]
MADDSEKLIREANRLAELQLTSQVEVMLAADQRATTFAGIMIAAVAVIAQRYESDHSFWHDDLGLVLLGLSAGLAAISARSIKVHVAGNAFSNFDEDIQNKREIGLLLRDLGKIYDDCSKSNKIKLRSNARLFNAALYLGILGFVVTIWPSISSLVTSVFETLVNLKGGA